MIKERRDNKGRLLLTGESQLKNGSYTYRYTDPDGVRRSITNWRLLPGDEAPENYHNPECLRDTENRILASRRRHVRVPQKDKSTLNDFWEMYLSLKCEIAETTLVKYIYLYNKHIRPEFGKRPIQSIRYTDVKRFYISLLKAGLNVSTLNGVHNILHPIFDMAYRESYIDMNPTDGVINEFKKRKDWDQTHRDALTEKEQEALIEYVSSSHNYRWFLPIITVLLGTGIRCGELTGLTWNDIDFQRNVISVNHTMNYTIALNGKCEYIITTPKTKNANREIPMLKDVRETLEEMFTRRDDFNGSNQIVIDGYTGFIFRDLYGSVYNNRRINEALKRLTKDRKKFYVYKFRSMRVDAEKDGVARLAQTNDDRITPVGRVIRMLRIDEMPQLFCILRGDMTIVGPRPERPQIAEQYEKEMPEFALRLQAKAGLTGLAQVYGKYNTTPYNKLQMDLQYIGSMGVVTDLKIIFATIKILFMPESTEGVAQGQITAEKKEKE